MATSNESESRTTGDAPRTRVIARLVLGSALMLFLELALIRWLGSNVVHLSYFSNFVLLGSFLGIGLGFLIARRPWSILPTSAVLLTLLVAAVHLIPVEIDESGGSIIYFTSLTTTGPPPWMYGVTPGIWMRGFTTITPTTRRRIVPIFM